MGFRLSHQNESANSIKSGHRSTVILALPGAGFPPSLTFFCRARRYMIGGNTNIMEEPKIPPTDRMVKRREGHDGDDQKDDANDDEDVGEDG